MSFPVFKDISKCVSDLLSDDFDTKYSLKVKSAGPSGTTLTTTTNYTVDKEGKKEQLAPKLSLKWPHESGFTLEKLEVTNDCKFTVETSLVKAVEGLKLEFKGNDCGKADLSFTYKVPAATVTGDFDIANLSSVSAAVVGGSGPVIFGATGELKKPVGKDGKIDDKFNFSFGAALSYSVPKVAFVSLKTDNSLSNFSSNFSYAAHKDVSLIGEASYKTSGDVGVVAGAVYKCNKDTTIKVKGNLNGVFHASVKQEFPGKFAVVGSAEVPKTFNTFKFGVNATLG